jgi:hypothetical protein
MMMPGSTAAGASRINWRNVARHVNGGRILISLD